VAGYAVLLLIELHFPDAGSLKAKRKELAPVKALLHQRLGWAVSEVEHHDLWQRATLAAAITGRTATQVDEAADRAVRALDDRFPQGVRVQRTLVSLDDQGGIG
jgi:uncharacterized protein YlxP (DUF503 family)